VKFFGPDLAMALPLKLVSISGSPRHPSRTNSLVSAAGQAFAEATGADWQHIALPEIAPVIFPALSRDALPPAGEAVIRDIEAADILIVGTPVYRASFTGVFKHLFDLVHYEALRGRIALLTATGGSTRHALVTEHQLRPLLGFFGVHTLPTTIYAEEQDFTAYRLTNPAIAERIQTATGELLRLLGALSPATATAA
jgi:FMN reductase